MRFFMIIYLIVYYQYPNILQKLVSIEKGRQFLTVNSPSKIY